MQAGSSEAAERVFGRIYAELREIAERQLRQERAGHTLQPTALVNEAYLKLAANDSAEWAGRDQFMGVAAVVMRRVLVDHARARSAKKRGGGAPALTALVEIAEGADDRGLDLIEIHDALERFETIDPRAARVVELRFFGGLTMQQIARVLGVSVETAKRDWTLARGWLAGALGAEGDAHGRP